MATASVSTQAFAAAVGSAINLSATAYVGTKHTFIECVLDILNNPSPTEYYGPLIETPGINTFQCIVGPNETKAFRAALMNPQTPNPSYHGKVFGLFWSANNYGRSGDLSNITGTIELPYNKFDLNFISIPMEQSKTLTFLFLSTLPDSINQDDPIEMQIVMLCSQFKKWHQNVDTSYVVLHITESVHRLFVQAIPEFDTYFKSVHVSNNIYYDFICKYLGCCDIPIADTVMDFITVGSKNKITTNHLHITSIKDTANPTILFRGSGVERRIQFSTNNLKSGARFSFLVENGDEVPTTIILTDRRLEIDVNYEENEKINVLIDAILFYEGLLQSKERSTRYLTENKEQVFAYLYDSPLKIFEGNDSNEHIKSYGKVLYGTIYQELRYMMEMNHDYGMAPFGLSPFGASHMHRTHNGVLATRQISAPMQLHPSVSFLPQ